MWLTIISGGLVGSEGLVSSWSRRYGCPWGTGRWRGEVKSSTTSWNHIPLPAQHPSPCFSKRKAPLGCGEPIHVGQLTSPILRAPNSSKAAVTGIKLNLWLRSSQTSYNLSSQITRFSVHWAKRMCSPAHHMDRICLPGGGRGLPIHTIWALHLDPVWNLEFTSVSKSSPMSVYLHTMWFFPLKASQRLSSSASLFIWLSSTLWPLP